jgi:glycosyltransferase involved in cell wall biosynthesis
MENKYLLTIVTVVKNDQEGIKLTYKSISEQIGNKLNFEWIIINGGEILSNYKETDKSIFQPIYIYNDSDFGIFDAMNRGIEKSNGDYIYFLNSGDSFINAEVLSKVCEFLNQESPNILAGNVETIWGDKLRASVSLAPWVAHQGVFVKSQFIKKYMFDARLKFYGDLDLWKAMMSNNEFLVTRVDLLIARFKMGGAGNNPNTLFKRLRERNFLSKRYQESNFIIFKRTIVFYILYLICYLFGNDVYYKIIIKSKK